MLKNKNVYQNKNKKYRKKAKDVLLILFLSQILPSTHSLPHHINNSLNKNSTKNKRGRNYRVGLPFKRM